MIKNWKEISQFHDWKMYQDDVLVTHFIAVTKYMKEPTKEGKIYLGFKSPWQG